MKISIINKQSVLNINNKKIKKQIKFILKNENIFTDEIILNFVDEKKIKNIHLKYFNDATTTDCISFPIDSINKKIDYHILGEAFICSKTVIKNSKKYKNNLNEELTLYIIHCILHLIGYNDINKKEKNIMRKKENYYISLLKEKKII